MRLSEKGAMATERSPLIQSVAVAPPRERYPHRLLRQVCTALLSTIVVAGVIVLFVPWNPFKNGSPSGGSALTSLPSSAWPESSGLSYGALQKLLLETPSEEKSREWSKYYTSGPHLAGKNLSQAEWTRDRWEEFGIKAEIVSYDVLLNYPRDHRLALLETKGNKTKVKYEAVLEEDVIEEDSTSGLETRIPTFHGYSANGNVTGQYVWVNYGSFQDFQDLVDAGIELKGKIALAKYGNIFRGLKIKRAEELGMIGCILYSDPGDDGDITEQNGYEKYPMGPARQESSVQRGSANYLSFAPGDPTTPGWPSKPGAPRAPTDGLKPFIPSIPISYKDALPLLKALNGHGPNVTAFNKYWQRGNGLRYKGVDYNIGPSPPELTLNLMNDVEYVTTPIWNVIGVINGTAKDEVVVLGNHRDAWIAGGAGDPNSGSAALNEVIRGFGKALETGWQPLRTLVFASWDGEEYALIGSTEWVEEYIDWLSNSTVAYLNVDVGVQGPAFRASAAPLLDSALIETTKMVPWPNQTGGNEGSTVYDHWSKVIRTMGSGSDFTAFQDFAGIPCTDMGFSTDSGGGGDADDAAAAAIYHYHSNYDSFDWMEKYGDPGWHFHVAAARTWGLLAAMLAETPIIPFNATNYAAALAKYVDDKKALLDGKPGDSASREDYDFAELDDAVARFAGSARKLDARAARLADQLKHVGDIPGWKWWKRAALYARARAVNRRYQFVERLFVHGAGLDGRTWFKHTVFAPGRWTGYAGATLPGLVESIEDGDAGNFARWRGIIARQVVEAAKLLRGERE